VSETRRVIAFNLFIGFSQMAGARKPALAVAAYRHALKLSPEFLSALEEAAQIEYQQDAPDAEAFLQRVLALRPADPTTHAMLAALRYKSGEYKEATAHFQQAEPVIRTQFAARSEFGVCLSKLDRLDEAIPVLQQAFALDEGSHPARYNLALALWKTKNDEGALHVLEPELQVDPVKPVGHENQESFMLAAEISEARNDTPLAVALLRRAIVVNPQNIQAYLSFATLSNDHASYQVGIDMLNLGLSQLPRAAQLYSARGVIRTTRQIQRGHGRLRESKSHRSAVLICGCR
jgi:Tfp pilus assembly protein PilF